MTKDEKSLSGIVDYMYEVGIMAKTPRSGFHFLGTGQQSLAEHNNRVVFIGYALARMARDAGEEIDEAKLLKMCLVHDLSETRISDLNYVHQKYVQANDAQAIDDLAATLPFGDDLKAVHAEYEERESRESKLAKDADNLEWIISLKEQADMGNTRAEEWIVPARKRILTPEGEALVTRLLEVSSQHWSHPDMDDEWWVKRGKTGGKKG